jgi:CBS domain-containing protein
MDRHNVGSVVVTHGDALTGIVTDRDIVLRAVARGFAADVPVSAVMTNDIARVFVRADITDAAAPMRPAGCVGSRWSTPMVA